MSDRRTMDTAGDDSRPLATVDEIMVAENGYVSMYMNRVRFASGREGTHARIVEPMGGVVVVARNPEGGLYLHRVYRYAADVFSLEFIRGFAEENETPRAAALRELSEEANFVGDVVGDGEILGYVRPNATLLSSRIPILLIDVSDMGPSGVDPDEAPRGGRWYSEAEVRSLVRRSRIEDGFTLAALSLLNAHSEPR